ncbi:AIR synthase-related protein [Cyclobacterium qasimii]|uniref:Hydrogenase expression/formation factor related protein n=1 Tax=Cyclobacterium qasimii M12-11B TaxID=641524 RepID=S7WVP8_9BACT|nr:AIR synthase-related protein [Cyclobacterium qasimii]EPR70834.1 Hydrogenase expression/formation factor related protein [Cyclobacterium qasimii M12-11B]
MSEQVGKVDERLLGDFITSHCGKLNKNVSVGPGFGIDVSIVELPGGQAMALTSDPLSLIPTLGLQESAWLSVHLMANDMATTGFAPQYGQFVLNLPATLSQADFKIYWQYIHEYCAALGVAITGGHTGFVEGQNSTIAGGGTFICVGPKDQMLATPKAQEGDCILITKGAAISSAAILAMSFPKTVTNKLGKEVFQEAEASFQFTSSIKDALIAAGNPEEKNVTAMHDVTEGGVLGAIYELASAANCGAVINEELIPVGAVQAAVCQLFSLDPNHCIGAGAMLITCKMEQVEKIKSRLANENIDCTEIGQLTSADKGILIDKGGIKAPMIYQSTDPYWEAFFWSI